jgi:peptidoglycan/xylan/chitin deacetylase (PgdA/CDA1 family)
MRHLFFLFLFSLLALSAPAQRHAVWSRGGIVRSDTTSKRVTLIFTGAHHADGADDILRTLKQERVKGAFFLTGKFLELYPDVVRRLV